MIAHISTGRDIALAALLVLTIVTVTVAAARCGASQTPKMPPIGAEPPAAVPHGLPP